MADRSMLRARRVFAATCWLAVSALVLVSATAINEGPGFSVGPDRTTAVGWRHGPAVRVLQFNLCDSGIARCYTGRSVGVAGAVIRYEHPDVVTLNEVCRDDVRVLARSMSIAHRGRRVASAFKAAVDRRTGNAFRCVNGQPYGIGVLAVLGSDTSGYRTYAGVYPSQNLTDPEERVWVCIDVPAEFLACTTHSAKADTAVALAQCRFLLASALPAVRRRTADRPLIVGADLNLRAGTSPGPQSCLPGGYHRTDDGALQDVIVGPAVAVDSRTVIDMRGVTDHPGLLVELTLA